MELAVGSVVTGKVTTITKFGAFVALEGGRSGLVHISEVAAAFVTDVHDFLAEGQEVSVKVLAITPEGKINLSVKQAQSQPPRAAARSSHRGGNSISAASAHSNPSSPMAPAAAAATTGDPSFEDKLKQFMALSASKQSELSRYIAGKRGGRRRK